MLKLVQTGNQQVIDFLKSIFPEPPMCNYFSSKGFFKCHCGFVCPGMKNEFEVLEEIELPDNRSLPPGIYRVVYHHGGNTSHFIHIEKWNPEKACWEHSISTHAGWVGDVMINWRGIKRVSVQGKLPL